MLIGFQKIDDVDVMFFSLIVQEYDDDCPPPNKGQVYLSYVDSVQYFVPRQLPTEIYQQIILAYFDYASNMGFKLAHLWVCPLQFGANYIFYMHPKDQKIPDTEKLRKWYKDVFEKGNLPYKVDIFYL
jgi:E1A/CREB-binding protein